jgi:hypothetical protein
VLRWAQTDNAIGRLVTKSTSGGLREIHRLLKVGRETGRHRVSCTTSGPAYRRLTDLVGGCVGNRVGFVSGVGSIPKHFRASYTQPSGPTASPGE